MSDRYYGYGTRRYVTDLDGHDVVLEFDKKRVVLNQARLVVDGDEVDRANMFYGDKSLSTTLPDGTTIEVAVDSGMVGEMTRAQARTSDGDWRDLVDEESADRP